MEAGVLTAEDIYAAVRKLEASALDICGIHRPHVTHPDLHKAPGWRVCAQCFEPFGVKEQ